MLSCSQYSLITHGEHFKNLKQYENQQGAKLLCPLRPWHLGTLMESVRALCQAHHQLCNVLHHNFLNLNPNCQAHY